MRSQGSSATEKLLVHRINGEIVVKDGELLFSRQGSHVGDQALLRLFLLEKGTFVINFNQISNDIDEADARPLTSVLMSVLNDVDEIQYMIRLLKTKSGDRPIKIVGDVSGFSGLEKLEKSRPMTITEMIIAMDGHPGLSIKQLIAASKKQLLKIAK